MYSASSQRPLQDRLENRTPSDETALDIAAQSVVRLLLVPLDAADDPRARTVDVQKMAIKVFGFAVFGKNMGDLGRPGGVRPDSGQWRGRRCLACRLFPPQLATSCHVYLPPAFTSSMVR